MFLFFAIFFISILFLLYFYFHFFFILFSFFSYLICSLCSCWMFYYLSTFLFLLVFICSSKLLISHKLPADIKSTLWFNCPVYQLLCFCYVMNIIWNILKTCSEGSSVYSLKEEGWEPLIWTISCLLPNERGMLSERLNWSENCSVLTGGVYFEASARENHEGVHTAFLHLCQEVQLIVLIVYLLVC